MRPVTKEEYSFESKSGVPQQDFRSVASRISKYESWSKSGFSGFFVVEGRFDDIYHDSFGLCRLYVCEQVGSEWMIAMKQVQKLIIIVSFYVEFSFCAEVSNAE